MHIIVLSTAHSLQRNIVYAFTIWQQYNISLQTAEQ